MSAYENPIFRITLMMSSGVSIYHRSFVDEDKFDEHLFSGFTSAILSFTKEFGNELSSISMKGLDLYFQQYDDLIIVLSVDSNFDQKEIINDIFNKLYDSSPLRGIIKSARGGLLEIPAGFDAEITTILSKANKNLELTSESKSGTDISKIPEQINHYLQGKQSAKQVALDLIGNDISSDEASQKLVSTEMIKELLVSSIIEKKTKKQLEELLKYMEKNSTKAAAKASKALF